MKKIFSTVLVLILLLSVNVFATPTNNVEELITPEESKLNQSIEAKLQDFNQIDKNFKNVITIQKNEYAMLKELQSKTDNELLQMGYNETSIQELRNVDFKAKLKERSKYSEKILKAMGYPEDKIQMLKKFDGSESQMYAIGATLTMSGYTGSYTYYPSTNQTKHQGIVTWEWNYCPTFTLTDIIGFSWFEGWHLSSEAYNKIYYYHSLGTRPTQSVINSFTAKETIAAENTFPITGTVYGDLDYMYARKGLVNAKIYTAGNCLNSNIMVKYGHREITGTPSVSLGSGIDFDFNWGTSIEGSCLIQYPSEY